MEIYVHNEKKRDVELLLSQLREERHLLAHMRSEHGKKGAQQAIDRILVKLGEMVEQGLIMFM